MTFQITDEVLKEVETLAGDGLSQEQIAMSLGIAETTLYQKKKLNPKFSQALKKGQAKGIKTITNKLYKNAEDGNVTAQIFYLKNRAPEQWSDRKEITIPEGIETTFIIKGVKSKPNNGNRNT